jgi:hypothetical protein
VQCPKCKRDINIKKNQVIDCKCRAKLQAVEIKKKLIIIDVRNDKGEN